jgi:Asp-tRNA(Asn)/Glu-tRNA(Gln) amidotransferase A subunit family amidase
LSRDRRQRGRRIAFCLAPPGRPVAAEVAAAFKVALARLETLGAEVEEMPGDGFEVEPIWRAINHTAWRARFEKLAADHGDVLSETFLKQLVLATKVSGVDYQRAMFDRTALFRRVQTLLQRVAKGRHSRDANHHPNRASDRPGPVRHDRNRWAGIQRRAAELVSLDHAVQHDRSSRRQSALRL